MSSPAGVSEGKSVAAPDTQRPMNIALVDIKFYQCEEEKSATSLKVFTPQYSFYT